jgi:hypothetical protein
LFVYGGISHTDEMIQDKKYFQYLILSKSSINTISGSSNLIEGSGRVSIILSKEKKQLLMMLCILLNLEEI